MDPDRRAALARWLASALEAEALDITEATPLSGGAIQENWLIGLAVHGGPHAGLSALVLRLDAPSQLPFSHDRAAEFRLLQTARAAGVTVPEPLAFCADACVLGRPFLVLAHVSGSAEARALTAGGPHSGLAAALGAEIARLHTIRPPAPALGFLPDPPADAARARVAELRGLLDLLDTGHPALEWGLVWLDRHAPPPAAPVLCHRDFRTGNFLVEGGEVTALLDWEFAGWSDPAEDLGWLCAPCWRFARPDLEAGGIGPRVELYEGYAAVAGAAPEDARVRYWQVMATARWAVIALWQAERHRSGAEPSLELALTAHIVPELELELLTLTRPA
jgi:aminoglycoside phosphotransferase (APT) family kinase protein